MEEQFIPLNDAPSGGLRKKNSFGSDNDLETMHQGEHDTIEYRLHAVHSGEKKRVSLWHDISLVHIDHQTKKSTNCMNFICEIPKFTRCVHPIFFCRKWRDEVGDFLGLNYPFDSGKLYLVSYIFHAYLLILWFYRKKFEIATDEEGTPIKQDTKKGKLREVSLSMAQQHPLLIQWKYFINQCFIPVFPLSAVQKRRHLLQLWMLPSDLGGPYIYPPWCRWLQRCVHINWYYFDYCKMHPEKLNMPVS